MGRKHKAQAFIMTGSAAALKALPKWLKARAINTFSFSSGETISVGTNHIGQGYEWRGRIVFKAGNVAERKALFDIAAAAIQDYFDAEDRRRDDVVHDASDRDAEAGSGRHNVADLHAVEAPDARGRAISSRQSAAKIARDRERAFRAQLTPRERVLCGMDGVSDGAFAAMLEEDADQ
jgi:hypothetical protein